MLTDDRLNLHLVRVEGPGDFALYGIGAAGQVTVYHSTHDGINHEDVLSLALVSHDHQNWAFNAPGHYRVSFRASATLVADSQFIESPEVTYYFAVGDVEPIPFPPLEPVILDYGDTDIAVVIEEGGLELEVFSGPLDRPFHPDHAYFAPTLPLE